MSIPKQGSPRSPVEQTPFSLCAKDTDTPSERPHRQMPWDFPTELAALDILGANLRMGPDASQRIGARIHSLFTTQQSGNPHTPRQQPFGSLTTSLGGLAGPRVARPSTMCFAFRRKKIVMIQCYCLTEVLVTLPDARVKDFLHA